MNTKLHLKITTKQGAEHIEGQLDFQAGEHRKSIQYFFVTAPTQSLSHGDELAITFVDGQDVLSISGRYPDVLQTIPHRTLCIWSLTRELIYENVFALFGMADCDEVYEMSQEMSGEVDEATLLLVFTHQ